MYMSFYSFLVILFICNLIEAFIFNKTLPKLIEGDIILNQNLKQGVRYGSIDLLKRWPSAEVHYLFSTRDEFDAHEKSIVRQGMDEIEKHSCVKFIELDPTVVNREDFVVITSNFGCFSSVGRQKGVQELSLQSPICINKGVIIHELMHTLGFFHEQSRTDRDEYVNILWNNIDKEEYINFDKYSEVIDYKMPYDYESIMHYEYNAFAKSKELTTIKPLNNTIPLSLLGRAKKLGNFTDNDIRKLNKYYECIV